MYQTLECVNLILKKGDTPYIGRITFTFCFKLPLFSARNGVIYDFGNLAFVLVV